LAKARLGVQYRYLLERHAFNWDVKYVQGLRAFNYKNPTFQNDYFNKWTGTMSYNMTYNKVAFSSNMHWQYSNDTLLALNQLSAGGPLSVRGYKSQTIIGSTGAYIKNDLSYRYGNFEPYIGIDMGGVVKDSSSIHGIILGGGIGVRYKRSGGVVDVFATQPIYATLNGSNHHFIGVILSYNY
jgi:hemolysin activation/secretion protein